MEHNNTAAVTEKTANYPKQMVIIRDCHWSRNTKVNVENRIVKKVMNRAEYYLYMKTVGTKVEERYKEDDFVR